MFFGSDNSSPAHPSILDALVDANKGYTSGYGHEEAMHDVTKKIQDLFEAPNASVYLVATGTAANSLALATITKPWETIFCHKHSHIEEDECGAPEFYTNGAKLTLVDGQDAKISPKSLYEAINFYSNKDLLIDDKINPESRFYVIPKKADNQLYIETSTFPKFSFRHG